MDKQEFMRATSRAGRDGGNGRRELAHGRTFTTDRDYPATAG
ncbi:hypothetical protein [Megasphaera elsdenii]|nr:hypothetical protein [Megasphaera elsdenii]